MSSNLQEYIAWKKSGKTKKQYEQFITERAGVENNWAFLAGWYNGLLDEVLMEKNIIEENIEPHRV